MASRVAKLLVLSLSETSDLESNLLEEGAASPKFSFCIQYKLLFNSALDAVAAAAMTSGQVAMNPRHTTQHDMRALLEAMRSPTKGKPPHLKLN